MRMYTKYMTGLFTGKRAIFSKTAISSNKRQRLNQPSLILNNASVIQTQGTTWFKTGFKTWFKTGFKTGF